MNIETYVREICNNSYAEFVKRLEEGKLVLQERMCTAYQEVTVYYDAENYIEVITRFYVGK